MRCLLPFFPLLVLLASLGASSGAHFGGVGDLAGGIFFSEVDCVSADGRAVVGRSASAAGDVAVNFNRSPVYRNGEAFLWRAGTGMLALGDLPGRLHTSRAHGVSSDGLVAVGSGYGSSRTQAFRWDARTGMEGLGVLPGTRTAYSRANAVSADGAIVVGSTRSGTGAEAFRWERGSGMEGIGDLPGGSFGSGASDVSADGSVVVGSGYTERGGEAFRWTREGGMLSLGVVEGGMNGSFATAVSSDGSVVVGAAWMPSSGISASVQRAFRWTRRTGIVDLGALGGEGVSRAWDVSGDGSLVVGRSWGSAFVWDAADGMRPVAAVLERDFGLDLAGWHLLEARCISADGRTIVGNGSNPDGRREGWIATLPRPPGR